MSHSLKRNLFIIAGAVALLALAALAALLFVDVNRFKPRLEAAASDALGMEVRIGGRLGMGFFPRFHVTAEDARIMAEHGEPVASAKHTGLWIELLPLFRKQLRLRRVELTEPRLFVVRGPGGRLNVERLSKAEALLGALDGASIALSDGTLFYADSSTGAEIEAAGFDLVASRIRLAGRRGSRRLNGLSVEANLACREIRTRTFAVSDLKIPVHGKNGVFDLDPITMGIFGGQAAASVRADVSGPIPLCQIRCSLPRFQIEEFLKILSPKRAAEGTMDFSASLSMHGTTLNQMIQTAAGPVSLRGRHLTLVGNDLDRVLSRFESSQNFNLVDVGAVFFAGPLGLAVTKGYNFASLFAGSGGTSSIETLVSEWNVERGVAQAQDVALATTKNRIALQGGLDFVNQQFANVTVAAVDKKGCARVRQVIHGSFGKPVVEKPDVLVSLAGPVLKLYQRTRGLFPSEPCEVFYSGSVPAPD